MELWRKLQKAGWVDENYQLTQEISQYKAALLANEMGIILNIDEKRRWAPFKKIWKGINFSQKYYDATGQEHYNDNLDEIRLLLNA